MKKRHKLAKILEGIGSLICLYPNENKRKITLPGSSVGNALKNDWEKVGLDMWKVSQVIESQHIVKQHRGKNDRLEQSPRHHF
ncbi:MAG TPA: hypothetical protein VNC84_00530 [Gammaproteobacteria bacterium]|jgi:hypothetical protein|nr:hypothetical protein [Gammaproteobacteria bacterium]